MQYAWPVWPCQLELVTLHRTVGTEFGNPYSSLIMPDFDLSGELSLKSELHMLRPITEKAHSGNGPVSLVHQWRHRIFCGGIEGGKMRFWAGKNQKNYRKWLILAIFSSYGGGGGQVGVEPPTGRGQIPPCRPLDAATDKYTATFSWLVLDGALSNLLLWGWCKWKWRYRCGHPLRYFIVW